MDTLRCRGVDILLYRNLIYMLSNPKIEEIDFFHKKEITKIRVKIQSRSNTVQELSIGVAIKLVTKGIIGKNCISFTSINTE